jgi:hypothetical protein
VSVKNFTASGGSNMTFLHLHEGQANVSVSNLVIQNGTRFDPAGETPSAISILGSSWNVTIDRARIVNNPQGGAIAARQSPQAGAGNNGLILRDIVVDGQFRETPVVIVDDDTVRVEGLDLRNAYAREGRPRMRIRGNHQLSNVLGWS